MGSTIGRLFKISTFGESHGKAVGVTIDGCPAGLNICEEDIQIELDRRKPGTSEFTTKRSEEDRCEILSGVFEGKTTGTPISIIVYNKDQISKDYANIADVYRPGHADLTFDLKYGIRDYRGGGRASARETTARVAAGAVAKKILKEFNIHVAAYTLSIGDITISKENFDLEKRFTNPLVMPDDEAYLKAEKYVKACMDDNDSAGGIAECIVTGVMPGLGETVFEKLDAMLSMAIMSLGAVKGIEFGAGFQASKLKGSQMNDSFFSEDEEIFKKSNHAGGVLGGMSDGSDIIFRAAFKPTSSIGKKQKTITRDLENVEIEIKGRHDPLILPRAIVVIEAMTAITLCDMLLINATSQMANLKKIYK